MSCNNYPKAALDELRRVAAAADRHPPRLVFAFDVGTTDGAVALEAQHATHAMMGGEAELVNRVA